MTIAHSPELADGEIELVAELPTSDVALAQSRAHLQRLRSDAKVLDELLADETLDLRSEWIGVFNGDVLRASTLEELLRQLKNRDIDPGCIVRHYVGDCGVVRV